MDYQEMPWSIEDTMDHLDKVRCSLVRQLRKINLHGKAESDIAELNYDFGRAINALKENQEYKQLGTLEEVRKAVERQQAKKVEIKEWSPSVCPSCGQELSESVGDGYYKHPKFLERCPNPDCGQRLDWSE